MTIPDDKNNHQDLISEYGHLSITNCQSHAGTYIGQPMWQAQNAQMLCQFLIESITPSFKGQVLLNQTNYTINNVKNGPCLLKQILSLTYIDTWAKAFHIRYSLIEMKQQLTNTASNITEFNDWVRSQVRQLHASGDKQKTYRHTFGRHTLQLWTETS